MSYDPKKNFFENLFAAATSKIAPEEKKKFEPDIVKHYKKDKYEELVSNMYSYVNKPVIFMTEEVSEDIAAIVKLVSDEVGWYCCVKKIPDTENYMLYKTLVPAQEVNGATCELTAKGQSDMMVKMMEDGQDDLLNDMKFWGHSHINMGVSPSGQDDIQIRELCKNSEDFFIRGIFNKKGDFRIDIYDIENKMITRDARVEIVSERKNERENFWAGVIKENVKPLVSSYVNNYVNNYGYWNGKEYVHSPRKTEEEKGTAVSKIYERANERAQKYAEEYKEKKVDKLDIDLEIDEFGCVEVKDEKTKIFKRRPEPAVVTVFANGYKKEEAVINGRLVDLNTYIFMLGDDGKELSENAQLAQKLSKVYRKATREEIFASIGASDIYKGYEN